MGNEGGRASGVASEAISSFTAVANQEAFKVIKIVNMSNEIVLHSSHAEGTSSRALVVASSSEIAPLQHSNHLVEKLRSEREEHRHKQIWIKDPHGGPYRKVRVYSGRKVWSKAMFDQIFEHLEFAGKSWRWLRSTHTEPRWHI